MVSLKEITLTNICLSLATGTCAVGASKELKRTTRRRHRDTTAELAGPGVLVKVCSCPGAEISLPLPVEMQVLALGEAANAGGETQREPVPKDSAHPAEKQQQSALPASRLFKYCHRKHRGLWGFAVRHRRRLLETPKTNPGGVGPALPWLTWHLQEPAVDTEWIPAGSPRPCRTLLDPC